MTNSLEREIFYKRKLEKNYVLRVQNSNLQLGEFQHNMAVKVSFSVAIFPISLMFDHGLRLYNVFNYSTIQVSFKRLRAVTVFVVKVRY